ncbi:MAG: radical SAM protein [Muribaculaceae bacterium]|nr:radical SAM protein [Muribaculaceae bacterium]
MLLKLPEEGLPSSPDSIRGEMLALMTKFGCVVNDDYDEAAEVYSRMIQNLSSDENFYLIVNPTLQCNCRCWYCIETHTESRMSDEMLEKLKQTILNILSRVKSITISFFGGEPLLEFKRIVKPLMEWSREVCKDNGKELNLVFTTNSLLMTDERIAYLKDYPNQSYQITIDGNRECHNKTRILKGGDSYAKVVDTIKKLAACRIQVVMRLNLSHDNVDTAYDIIEDFRDFPAEYKKYISLSCQQIWQDSVNGPLAEKFMEINKRFLDIGILPMPKKFNWTRESCYGDRLNSVVVNYNGDLFKCSAVDYLSDEPIANLEEVDLISTLENDFKRYLDEKMSDPSCRTCRVLPMCTRGCYKKVMLSKEGCPHPTDEKKDYLIINALEQMAQDHKINEVMTETEFS